MIGKQPLMSPASWVIAQSIQQSQSNEIPTSNSAQQPQANIKGNGGLLNAPASFNGLQHSNSMKSIHSNVSDNDIGDEMKEASKDRKIRTEPCHYKVRQKSKNVVKFIGVYRGINSSKQIFLLMSRRHIEQFNRIAQKWSNSTEVLESFNSLLSISSEISANSKIDDEFESDDDEIAEQMEQATDQKMFKTILENAQSLNPEETTRVNEEIYTKLSVTMCNPNLAQQVW